MQVGDLIPLAEPNLIQHFDFLAVHLGLRIDFRAVITQVFQVADHILGRGLDQVVIIDDRCFAQFVPKTVLVAGPVIDGDG